MDTDVADFTKEDETAETGGTVATTTEGTTAEPKNEEWKTAMAELSQTVTRAIAPREEKAQPTPEEIAEFWQVFDPSKVDPKFFQKFFNLGDDADEMTVKEKQDLFAKMQSGMMRQSVTATRNMLAQFKKELEDKYAPVEQSAAEQRAEKTRSRFFEKFPALQAPKDDGSNRWDKILKTVAQEISGQQFKTEADYFKALAEGAAKEIKEYVPDFDLGAAKQNTAVTSPRLPRTRVGGTGGSGGQKVLGKSQSDDDSESLDWMK